MTHPIDTVKSNLQGLGASKYSSSLDCARKIVASSGVSGLFRGLSPRICRHVHGVDSIFDVEGDRLLCDVCDCSITVHFRTPRQRGWGLSLVHVKIPELKSLRIEASPVHRRKRHTQQCCNSEC